jgi:hypothetical protein
LGFGVGEGEQNRYGGGEYGIKMVSNTRGKLRRVQWKHLFKDGSFNKLQIRGSGGRVRTTERMREIEQGKAESKFAGKVKKKEVDLIRAETKRKELQEQADRTIRMMEMKARQAEKDLKAGHKRRLRAMDVDVGKKWKVDMRAQEELDRQHRKKQDTWRSSWKTCRKTCVEPKRKTWSRRGQSNVAKKGWMVCGNTGMVGRKSIQTKSIRNN